MTKKTQQIIDKFVVDNRLDWRTLKMIGHHYLYLGEQVISKLTPEDIEEVRENEIKKQEEAEKNGKIYLIEPAFTVYLLDACVALFNLDGVTRNIILKEII